MSGIEIDLTNVDNVVADIFSIVIDHCNYPSIIRALEEAGYSEEEADAYLKAFGKRVGRDLGFL